MLSFTVTETRSVLSLASLYIVRMLGLFMVLPVLTLSGGDYTGSNVLLLGVALGIYGLTQALLQIPYGVLSDRYGRKPLIVIGLLVFALGSAIAATATSIEGLIIGRALQGAGAIAGVIMAMVGDLTSDQNRTKAMASIGASIGVAFALSLVIGPIITALGGVRWIFWVTLILSVIGLAIVIWGIPRVPAGAKRPLLTADALTTVLARPALLRLNLGIFVLHAVLMAMFVVLPLMLASVAIPQVHHAWVYLGVMLVAFCLMVPLIILGEKRRQVKRIFLSSILLAAVGLTVLAFFADGAVAIILAMLLFFVGFNYLEATLPSLLSKTIAAEYRGAGSGVFSTCQFLGAAVGGIAGGWLLTQFGLVVLMLVCVAVLLVWWLIALGMVVPKATEIAVENVVA